MSLITQLIEHFARISPINPFWVVGLLGLLLAYAIYISWPFSRSNFQKSSLLCLVPFLVPILMLIFAESLRQPSGVSTTNWKEIVLFSLLGVQILTHAAAIYWMRSYRFFAVVISFLQLWISSAVLIQTLMLVTGLKI
jgi:hypothetical protein